MPIYAYKCESCGHAKDVLQKMSDAPLTDCPACGAACFKKQLAAAAPAAGAATPAADSAPAAKTEAATPAAAPAAAGGASCGTGCGCH